MSNKIIAAHKILLIVAKKVMELNDGAIDIVYNEDYGQRRNDFIYIPMGSSQYKANNDIEFGNHLELCYLLEENKIVISSYFSHFSTSHRYDYCLSDPNAIDNAAKAVLSILADTDSSS